MGNSDFQFPPGFRFRPSDEELIVHYLENKVNSRPLPASVIAEIDVYKYNPWELPSLFTFHSFYPLPRLSLCTDKTDQPIFFCTSKALFGEDEWYFFTPREEVPERSKAEQSSGFRLLEGD
jgi:hypothetical protein